jgi:hypothetical protein
MAGRFTFRLAGTNEPDQATENDNATQEASMTKMAGIIGMARNAMIGVLAIWATVLILPATAEAGPGPQNIAYNLERIAYATNQVPGIRGLHRQDVEIDRLQSHLYRLDRISYHQHGRRARLNDANIERLQYRLRRMENRVEAKIARYQAGRHARRDVGRDVGRDQGRVGRWYPNHE